MSILKVNTIQDKGGNTIISSNGTGTLTLPSDLKMTPAFKAYISTSQSIAHATFTKVTFQTELYDTDSCYDNTTNYRFTPTSSGKYFFTAKIRPETSSTANFQLKIVKNGSSDTTYPNVIYINNYSMAYTGSIVSGVLEANGTTDYFEVFIQQQSGSSILVSSSFGASFEGYKLIGA